MITRIPHAARKKSSKDSLIALRCTSTPCNLRKKYAAP
jgi:hypothetical protein